MELDRITLLLAVSLLALGAPPVRGAEPPGRIEVRSYGTDTGLENQDITLLLEDGEGFIWACSADAVYRFDGGQFERFDRSAGVPSPNVSDMTLDARGHVLLATSEGVIRWDGERFVPVKTQGLPSRALSLRLDADQRLWVGTAQGLYMEDTPGQLVPAPGWPGGTAVRLWRDDSGELQILSDARLVRRGRDGSWHTYDMPAGHPARLLSLARDGQGRLWVSTEGWLAMQPRADAPFEEHSALLLGVTGAGLRLRVGQRGQLQLPTYEGLIEVEGTPARAHRLFFPERAQRMSEVLEDRQGSLWVASVGLHRSLGRGLWTVHDHATGLPSSIVWGLDRGPDGSLWVGTDAGIVQGTARGWVPIAGLRGYSLKVVRVMPDGRVWSAGNPTGLHLYDPRTQQLRTFGAEAGYAPNYSFGLVQEPDGTLWAATSSGLLRGVVTHGTPSFTVELPPADRVSFYGVARDEAGRIWAAGNGLRVREGGVFRRLGKADGLLNDRVRFVLPRRHDRICVSYIDPLGLSCFTYRDGRLSELTHLNRGTGLYNDVIYQLGEDRAGRLWVGTGAGVHVVGTDGTIEHFGASGGAPGDDFDLNSFLADEDGTVWTGTSNGLGQFEGERYIGPPAPPHVKILDLRLGSQPPSQAAEQGLRTPDDESSLEVRFADPGAFDESRLEHQERVVGLGDWHTVQGHSVRYKTLPPGHYRFELRARRGRGPWGPEEGFGFDVLPPWWMSWWAWLLGALGVGAAGWGLVRWRGLSLRRRNLELERLVSARTAELARAREKMAQAEKLSAMGQLLARLSHEINNPLTAIHNNLPPVREYFEQQAEALRRCREQLESTPEQAALVRRVWSEQDLDFVLQDAPEALDAMSLATARIRSIQADLGAFLRGERPRLEPGDLNQTVQQTVDMVRRSLRPGVRVELRLDELPPIDLHAGQLGQVLLNLLRNALDAVGAQGEVRVSTTRLPAGAELMVADSGPGIPPELRSRIFEPFFTTKDVGQGSGLGLAICRQIITDHHGGSLELDESVVGGACFRVVLPLSRASREAA